MRKCSTTGPRVRAGRKFNAPTRSTVPIRRKVNVPPETGNDPGPGGTNFLDANEPAMAMIGTIIRKRPIKHPKARVVSYQQVLAVRPANALPLLPVTELKA